jgi:hypothetical protein
VPLFLVNVAPNFVRFYVTHGQVFNLPLHKAAAAFPGDHEQAQDRIAVDAGHSLYAPHAHAFEEQLQDAHSLPAVSPASALGSIVTASSASAANSAAAPSLKITSSP